MSKHMREGRTYGPPPTHCPAGHELAVTARQDGKCSACMRRRARKRSSASLSTGRGTNPLNVASLTACERILDLRERAETATPWEREELLRKADEIAKEADL